MKERMENMVKGIRKIVLLILMIIAISSISAGKMSSNDEKEILDIINSYNNGTSETVPKSNIGISGRNGKELRGVWVASVINIDWPSKKGLSIETQKREYLQILENVKKWNMNAVFVQVKPVGDAIYPSRYAPWSEYLTGTQGMNPGYDPLKFMIEEAHKRGIEFHAWFNPYRLTMNGGIEKLASNNIGRKRPEWTVMYGGKLYLNPGIPEVNDYVVDSIMEVVKNYNVDGVHMDDYFYPYKVKGQEYPDSTQYKKYGRNFSNIGDWRRNNINLLIKKLNSSIKKERSDISFGISPFGVWRNSSTDPARGSRTQASIQNYDDLYADILKWMEKRWLDYVAPQIYWNQGFEVAEYNTLVNWWSTNARKTNTDLYIGQAAYKVKDWSNSNELANQINYNRKFSEVKGSIFFSYKSLRDNPKNVVGSLLNGPYNR